MYIVLYCVVFYVYCIVLHSFVSVMQCVAFAFLRSCWAGLCYVALCCVGPCCVLFCCAAFYVMRSVVLDAVASLVDCNCVFDGFAFNWIVFSFVLWCIVFAFSIVVRLCDVSLYVYLHLDLYLAAYFICVFCWWKLHACCIYYIAIVLHCRALAFDATAFELRGIVFILQCIVTRVLLRYCSVFVLHCVCVLC